MRIKEFWNEAGKRLKSLWQSRSEPFYSDIDDDGLLTLELEADQADAVEDAHNRRATSVLVKAVQPLDKRESLEKLQEGFERLIEQLQGINRHLDCQISQQQELMHRLEQLPQVLGNLPGLVDGQRKVTQGLLDQMRIAAARDQRLLDALDRIPAETARQNETLVDIHEQLTAATGVDAQMAQQFNRFTSNMDKLQQSTATQAESIDQMQQTFASNERHLRYMLTKQEKRFNRLFWATIGVCLSVILILAGVALYLTK